MKMNEIAYTSGSNYCVELKKKSKVEKKNTTDDQNIAYEKCVQISC